VSLLCPTRSRFFLILLPVLVVIKSKSMFAREFPCICIILYSHAGRDVLVFDNSSSSSLLLSDEILKLQPYTKSILKPQSETIIQAITSSKRVEIVKAEKIMPGIFIGNCLVKSKKSTCPISVINITEEQVMPTPLVTIEELPEDVTPDTAEKHTM